MQHLPTCLTVLCASAAPLAAQAYTPAVPPLPASEEARAAIERMQIPPGFRVELVAAEPLLAHPVALDVGVDGRILVAETFRHHKGVTDMRDHRDWLDQDIANRTVAERIAMLKERNGDQFLARFGVEHERISALFDDDGDGRCERSTIFALGFNAPEDGIGAGILARGTEVYYTCIPKLWKLGDADRDGLAETRQVLSDGYGVHIALLGHDLHGLLIGPDGRLYFSCGDRGLSVETAAGRIELPDTGGVLRCNLDGSELELFATGLRNPQELAFDDWGDLFTGDNNSDGGDQARWVHVLEGGDSGWRYPYQWIEQPTARGPWNEERLWYPHWDGQAAYIVPPLANVCNGPSGLAHAPGTGLPASYNGHFFLVDFGGGPGWSGIHDLSVERKGATHALLKDEHLVWNALPVDCTFGPDGALYWCDWVDGWNQSGKGRIYRLVHESAAASPAAREVQSWLAGNWKSLSSAQLRARLGHPDQRVRLEAQFELATRGTLGLETLARALAEGSSLLERLHGLWGAGQLARRGPLAEAARVVLIQTLSQPEPELRAQAAHALGDAAGAAARLVPQLIGLLSDENPRVRYQAAIALGKSGANEAYEALLGLAAEVGPTDPALRHAAIFGLAKVAGPELLAQPQASGSSSDARLAQVVALRRQESPLVAAFLQDSDERVVLEAARAIHDLPIEAAEPALAELAGRTLPLPAPLARRVLAANERGGGALQADAVAQLAAQPQLELAQRQEALEILAQWGTPRVRDRVHGFHRPLAARDTAPLAALALELYPKLSKEAAPELLDGWVRLAQSLDPAALTAQQRALLCTDLDTCSAAQARAGSLRAAALRVLAKLDPAGLALRVDAALDSRCSELTAAALVELERLDPAAAMPRVRALLSAGEIPERRAALGILGRRRDAASSAALAQELGDWRDGLFPAELELELLDAAQAQQDAALATALQQTRDTRGLTRAPLGPWLASLQGGDAQRGQAVFESTELSCQRCHAIVPDDSAKVGPPLAGIGARLTRLDLLRALVEPNARLAPGYESTLLVREGDTPVAGRILSEDEREVRVLDAEGTIVSVDLDEIEERRTALSAMPTDLTNKLDPARMRDLLEYLAQL